MTPAPSRTDIEQFRTVVSCHLGLQYEDEKLDYLADVMRQRMQSVGRSRFESCSAYLGHLNASSNGAAVWRWSPPTQCCATICQRQSLGQPKAGPAYRWPAPTRVSDPQRRLELITVSGRRPQLVPSVQLIPFLVH